MLPDVDIKLPPLKGANIIEHFHEIAHEQVKPYKELIECLANAELAEMPKTWKMTEGWTRYDHDGNAIAVPYPDEKALIFDIEVCMREGSAPTMACAVGPQHWYSWCSKTLTASRRKYPTKSRRYSNTSVQFQRNDSYGIGRRYRATHRCRS